MHYRRMPIEVESPEQMGYDKIRNNLSESSYTDTLLKEFAAGDDLGQLLLCYGSHEGHRGLRELIVHGADEPMAPHGPPSAARLDDPWTEGASPAPGMDDQPGKVSAALTPDDVLITIGAAGALFIIATTLLEPGDELIVVRPNYATNIETPAAIGAKINYIDVRFEDRWALDIEKLRTMITPKTRYISVTHPHNPTGACLQEGQIKELGSIAETHGIYVLVDETYRDMVFGKLLPLAATWSPRIISISSLSKTYGLPGLRTGWIICRDKQLYETFLAAKEQMHICGPVIDEELAYRYLLHRDRHFGRISADIREKFGMVKGWMQQQDDWEWVEPEGGCVCFPRLKDPLTVDLDRFYRVLLEQYGTYVGPGHWFGMPDRYIRLGFGWPSKPRLAEGLAALTKAVASA